MSHPSRRDLHGLDTLRSAAILLVLAYHYAVFASGEPTFGVLSHVGWSGVDLFFVLSGYLIGRQVLGGPDSGGGQSLGRFYARRALRTLPNYWVVLALFLLFPPLMGGVARTEPWRFLTFTQNFGLLPGTAFSHAWSLCVEEQFYLLLPLLVLAVAATRKPVVWMWAALLGAVAIATLARWVMWRAHGHDQTAYYVNVCYPSLTRFDELLPGVALALMQMRHPAAWAWLTQRHVATLVVGLVASAGVLAWFHLGHVMPNGAMAFGPSVFGYPLLALSFGVVALAALSRGSPLCTVRVPGASWLAVLSYALYLVHKPVFHALKTLWPALDARHPAGVLLLMGASVLVAWMLYRVVEAPVMRWRDRWFDAPATSQRGAGVSQVS